MTAASSGRRIAFLDILLGVATLVVEAHHPVRVHRHIGDNEADFWEQLARMPFDLGDQPAWLIPALRLILDVLEDTLDLGWRGAADGAGQSMRNLLLKHCIGGQPDGVEIARLFQPRVDRRDRIGGVGTQEAHEVALGISGDDRIEHILPAVSTVDVATAQGAAFQHAELVEQEVRVVAGAVKMPVPGRAFLITMGRADRAVHVQHDVLQPVAIMKAVNPRAVQIGKRCPVLGQGQRLGRDMTESGVLAI